LSTSTILPALDQLPAPPTILAVGQFNYPTTPMSSVTVKNKYQVVIPQGLREQIGLNVGDLLEARIERGKITFTPKVLVDRGIAQSLDDFKSGRSYGPFKTHQEFLASLHSETKKLQSKKAKRVASR